MGSVSILTGRSGSGKSRYLRRMAADIINAGGRVLYIVPEQFTFETERALAEALGGGLWDAEVYSFTSLARKVLQSFGERRALMNEEGRLMVIRKCADELAPKLAAFGKVYHRSGFAGECARFFMEAQRAGIDPPMLLEAAQKQGLNTALGAKLNDLALIYAASAGYIAANRLDGEACFKLLAELLPKSELAARHVIIDGFDMITKRLYGVIAALIDTAPSVCIALRLDNDPACRDKAVFAADRRILNNILPLCESRGIKPRFITPQGEAGRHGAAALAHLEHEGFAFPYKKFAGASGGAIELFAATDVKAEANAAAEKVQQLINEGFRYRDIAIIASDVDKYLEPMSRALRARRIPFFTDAKRRLISYAASQATLCALKLAGGNYSGEGMIALAKTGLCGVTAEAAEIFENYVLARGLRGSAFKLPFPQDAPPAAEEARAALMGPLEQFGEALSAARTAGEKVRALYAYTQAINMRGQLNERAASLRAQGRLEKAEELAQVYNLLLGVMDQLYSVFGQSRIGSRRFAAIYKEGIEAYEVGVIPAAADQVLLGSLGRSKARSIRALLILGAANGHFPAAHSDDGMIDDEERAAISQMGYGELPSTAEMNSKELSDAYGAVTKPTERLWLSYTMGSGSDTAAACELIDRIADMFEDISIRSDISAQSMASAPSAYAALITQLRTGAEAGQMPAGAKELYAALSMGEEYAAKLAAAQSALIPNSQAEPFGQALAHKLYGEPFRGGITSLEKFNACPFKHFAAVGLRLAPRMEYRERKTDEGLFCHEAIARFTTQLIGLGAEQMPDAQGIDKLLDSIIPPLLAEHNGGVLKATARNNAAAARLVRRVRATAHAIAEQIRRGQFGIAAAEAEFGKGKKYPELVLELKNGEKYVLSGRIDRIDEYNAPSGEKFVRVIDYKTKAGAVFDCADIDDGIRLQLPLYIAAIEAAGAAERAAGMYYMPVQDPTVEACANEAELKERLFKEFRLRGISLDRAELIRLGGGESVQPGERSGWRLEQAQLEGTISHAMRRAKRAAYKIACGHAEAKPLINKRGYEECAYCDYKSLCGFDPTIPGNTFRYSGRMSREEFLEEISNAELDD